jgi:1,4-alpha-glucan branching enzyme
MAGDDWQKFANLRAYYAFMWGYPGKKLLFMGQEFAQRERMERGALARLGPARIRPASRACALVRDLNQPIARPALHARDCEPEGFEWLIVDDNENSVFAWARKAPGAAPSPSSPI